MRIKEKINMDFEALIENGAINIVAFGDSITHGAFGAGVIDYEAVYHALLRKKINALRNYVPVNVINSGIGGDCAQNAIARMDRDIFAHHPDLVIVCFGLNDVNGTLEDYVSSLETIFRACKEHAVDTIFMTPNMLNTYVSDGTEEKYREYAKVTAEYQNSGRMDTYMQKAKEIAEECGIAVCDCYSVWKKMQKDGVDTTVLLANSINHPTRKMHEIFADELFKMMFGNAFESGATESTMYRKE